jgi:hypothetical protein
MFNMFKAKGFHRIAVLGRVGIAISDGFIGQLWSQLSGNPVFPPTGLIGADLAGTTVVMKRCSSEFTNPSAPDCMTDADCAGTDTCVLPQMRSVSRTYSLTNSLDYLTWVDAMRRANVEVIMLALGSEEQQNFVQAFRIQEFTPAGALALTNNFAALEVATTDNPFTNWGGPGIWSKTSPGGISGRYMGTSPEYYASQLAADALYINPYLPAASDPFYGTAGLWAATNTANYVALQIALEKAGKAKAGFPTYDPFGAGKTETNWARVGFEMLHLGQCGTGRDTTTGDVVGSGSSCSNFPPLYAANPCTVSSETCTFRSTFFGGIDFGAFGMNFGATPSLSQYQIDSNGVSTQKIVTTADELVAPAQWPWELKSCEAGKFLDKVGNVCSQCPAGMCSATPHPPQRSQSLFSPRPTCPLSFRLTISLPRPQITTRTAPATKRVATNA